MTIRNKIPSRETRKIILLISLVSVCILSFFTSQDMGEHGLQRMQLKPPTNVLCKNHIQPAKHCDSILQDFEQQKQRNVQTLIQKRLGSGGGSDALSPSTETPDEMENNILSMKEKVNECKLLQKQIKKCENTVTQAYRKINIGTCLPQIQSSVSCQEYHDCTDKKKGCGDYCKDENKAIHECASTIILREFKKKNLDTKGLGLEEEEKERK